MDIQPRDIIDFWYSEKIKKHWFDSTPEIDDLIRDKYESLWQSAAQGEIDAWYNTAQACLALAIVLDQFPLNMFRGQVKSFSTESMAIAVALHAVHQGYDRELGKSERAFLYMPLMHSENMEHQNLSVQLFEAAELQDNARFARHHRELIRRFGRFPHRNNILGRQSTPEEIAYLASDEAFLG